MARRRIRRLDVATLDGAHGRFLALADKQPHGEVRNALRLAAVITSILAHEVNAAAELRVVLRDTIGGAR
jgi:hypothetical protein